MAICAGKKNTIVRRDLVEVLACWKLWRFPKCFDPSSSSDPFSSGRFTDALLHSAQKIFKRRCPFQVHSHFAFPNPKNVTMGIRKAGHHRLTAKVDRFRS